MKIESIQDFNSNHLLISEILILICKFLNVPCALGFEVKHSKFFCRSFRTCTIIRIFWCKRRIFYLKNSSKWGASHTKKVKIVSSFQSCTHYLLFSKIFVAGAWRKRADALTFMWLLARVHLRTRSPNSSCIISYPSNQLQTFIELRCCDSFDSNMGFTGFWMVSILFKITISII